MKKSILYFSLTFFSIMQLVTSCKNTNGNEIDPSKGPIVTVFDRTLYQSDIKGLIPYGTKAADSALITQSYIKNWTEEQLVYNNALKNFSNEDEIEELVEAYRKTLITNSYLTQLLKERLDKTITDSELISFFEKNKERFPLKNNIIKGLYLKIPKNSSQLNNFKKWYKDTGEEAVNNIEKHHLQNALAYENFYTHWVSMDEVINNIPQSIADQTTFLKNNKTLESSDSLFVYLLNISDYKTIGSEVPFEYIKDQLLDAYRESQREEFVKNLTNDLYEKAQSEGKIHYYEAN